MRILHTPVRFYPSIGGVERYVFDLSKQLVKNGHFVKIFCADDPASNIVNINGVFIERLNYIGKIANTNITPSLFYKLIREDFEVIHTYLPTPWSLDLSVIIGKLKKKKVIVTYCNDLTGNTLLSKLLSIIYSNSLLKLNLLLVDKIIIIQSDYIKYSRYLKRFRYKIVFISPGVDITEFKNKSNKRLNNTVLFLSVLDRFHDYKGLNYLLEAITIVKQEIPDIKLMVGGKGELMDEYKKYSLKLGIKDNVDFLGFIPQKKIVDLYNQASVFILPSIGFEEGFGIVLLEAMACSTPVIATNIVGVSSEIELRNCGLVIKPKSTKQIANSIIKILRNKDLANLMGENARKLVKENYDWQIISKAIEKTYKEL